MSRSKYNVSSNKEKRTYDGVVFDSELECRFYKEIILPNYKSGKIKNYELQKPYVLQEKFKRDGKTISAIKYVADFFIEWDDGRVEVIDTKGMADSVAKIKRKMMWSLFPALDFKWISYCKKYGGWIEFDELNRLRRDAKKNK